MQKYPKYIFLFFLATTLFFNTAHAATTDTPNPERPYLEFVKNLENQQKSIVFINAKNTETFNKNILNIKDPNKKNLLIDINQKIQKLNNEALTAYKFSYMMLDQTISNIESRMNKSEATGVDVSLVKTSLTKSKTLLSDTSAAIMKQAANTYIINTTNVNNLKPAAKSTIDTLTKDIQILKDKTASLNDSVQELETTIFKVLGKDLTPEQTTNNINTPTNK